MKTGSRDEWLVCGRKLRNCKATSKVILPSACTLACRTGYHRRATLGSSRSKFADRCPHARTHAGLSAGVSVSAAGNLCCCAHTCSVCVQPCKHCGVSHTDPHRALVCLRVCVCVCYMCCCSRRRWCDSLMAVPVAAGLDGKMTAACRKLKQACFDRGGWIRSNHPLLFAGLWHQCTGKRPLQDPVRSSPLPTPNVCIQGEHEHCADNPTSACFAGFTCPSD